MTLRDLQRLDAIRGALRAVYEAIAATSIQAKPAILAWLDRADDEAEAIFNKGARRAAELGNRGAYERLHLDKEFITRLVQAAQARGWEPGAGGEAEEAGAEGIPAAAGAEPAQAPADPAPTS